MIVRGANAAGGHAQGRSVSLDQGNRRLRGDSLRRAASEQPPLSSIAEAAVRAKLARSALTPQRQGQSSSTARQKLLIIILVCVSVRKFPYQRSAQPS